MILTIRMDDVLRQVASRPSRNLVTRPTGAAVRSTIEQAMASTPCPTTLLDFESVGMIDLSCADEIVAKLLARTAIGRFLVLRGVDDAQAEAIGHVLDRQGLAIASLPRACASAAVPAGRRVLGRTTPDQLAAFEAVHVVGAGTAERLAAGLQWTVARTAAALDELVLRRLVVGDGGTYRPLSLA